MVTSLFPQSIQRECIHVHVCSFKLKRIFFYLNRLLEYIWLSNRGNVLTEMTLITFHLFRFLQESRRGPMLACLISLRFFYTCKLRSFAKSKILKYRVVLSKLCTCKTVPRDYTWQIRASIQLFVTCMNSF